MSKVSETIQGTRVFFGEVGAELKKCSWPDRAELFDSTVVVILSMVLLAAFIALCDIVLRQLVRLVF